MEMITSLKEISFHKIFETFNTAFQDYEMQLNKNELETMLQRRGFVPELSFGAFINEKLVSFTLNGIGTFNGLKTAYDTGTGTIKDFRGKGLASRIFQHSIPFLKQAGVTQYLLEVLQHNSEAVSVYKKQGFTVSREFNYFTEKKDKINFCSKAPDPAWKIIPIDLTIAESSVDFYDFNPSWQNSIESIARKQDDFIIRGIYNDTNLLGFCILEPNSGDITQIAVHKKYRRKGIGTQLLKEILKLNRHHSVKIINTEINCDSLNKFVQANSFPLRGKQFEMIKPLL